jgi:hypothetical protein
MAAEDLRESTHSRVPFNNKCAPSRGGKGGVLFVSRDGLAGGPQDVAMVTETQEIIILRRDLLLYKYNNRRRRLPRDANFIRLKAFWRLLDHLFFFSSRCENGILLLPEDARCTNLPP